MQNEWVISRVFQKLADGKKVHISDLMMPGSGVNKFEPVGLPPLMDYSPYLKSRGRDSFTGTDVGGSLSHVTYFSDQTTEDQTLTTESKDNINLTMFGSSSLHLIPNIGSLLDSDPLFLQDNSSILKMLRDSEENKFKKNLQSSSTSETELTASSLHGHALSGLAGLVNLDCVWKF